MNVASAPTLRDQRDDPSNNEASASVTIGRQTADLEVRKEASKTEVRETGEVEFLISVHNHGPDRASDVVVTDHLPPGLEFAGASPDIGSFNPDRLEWRIGHLDPGSLARLRITAVVARGHAGESLTNRAVADVLEHREDDPSNNEGSATIRALPEQTEPEDHAFKTAGNTQLVGGTFTPPEAPSPAPAPPIAAVKTHSLLKNTPSLMVNNTGSQVTAQGGDVWINADGTFIYTPPIGFTDGQDSFTYTTDNGFTATVTIDLSEMVWYVDNTNEGGTGESHDPFEDLWDTWSASGPGDAIFVFTGDGTTNNYDAGITLKPGQHLIGEGVGLDIPGIGPVFPPGAMPKITNGCGYAVDMADGSEVGGIHIFEPTSRGISADGTNGGSVFDVLITDSWDHSVKLLNTTGNFDFFNVDIVDSQRAGFKISNGSPNVDFDGSISGAAQFAIEIGGTTGGTASFRGDITSDSDGSGVELSSVSGNVMVEGLTSTDSYSGVEVWGGTGMFTFDDLQVLGINGDGSDAFRVEGGSATVVANLIEGGIFAENGEAVRIQNTTGGAVTFNGSTIEGADGVGISLFNNDGDINFNSDVVLATGEGDPAPPAGAPSEVVNVEETAAVGGRPSGMLVIEDGSGPVDFQFVAVMADDGQVGVVLYNQSGQVTVSDGTIDTYDGQAFWASSSSANVNFSSVEVDQGSDGGIYLNSNSGTFTFSNAILEFTNGTGIRADLTGQVNIFGTSVVMTSGTSGSRRALDINDTSIDINLMSLTCDTCVVGIQLDEVSGDLLIDGGTVNSTSTTGIDIVDFDGNFRFDGTITNNSGRSANVQDSGPGSVQFGGLITDNGSGISLSNNAGTGIRFDGGMALNTGPNTGFYSSSGGTLDVTGTNTINTSTGTAIDLDGTTIGGTGVTFESVSSDGATNGINLSGVTGGPFMVTGTGTAGSGGLIQNSGAAGIEIDSGQNITFSNLDVTTSNMNGVNADGVDGLTFNNVGITNNGSNGISIDDPIGTTTITNSSLQNNFASNLLASSSVGTPSLVVSGSTIATNTNCSSIPGIQISSNGTSNFTASFSGNSISDHMGIGLATFADGSSMLNLSVTGGNSFSQNWGGIDARTDGGASTVFGIDGNSFNDENGTGIGIFGSTTATGGSSVSGSVTSNTFDNINSGDGIKIDNGGLGTGTIRVHDNDFANGSVPGGSGLSAIVGSGLAPSGTLNLTVTMNDFDMNDDNTGVLLSGTQSSTMCLDVGAPPPPGPLQNMISAGDAFDMQLSQLGSSSVSVVGLGTSTSTPSDVETVLSGRNNSAGTSVSIATSVLAGGASCPLP